MLPGAAVVGALVGVAVKLSPLSAGAGVTLPPLLPLLLLPLVALVPQPHTRKNSSLSTKTSWPVASTSPTMISDTAWNGLQDRLKEGAGRTSAFLPL